MTTRKPNPDRTYRPSAPTVAAGGVGAAVGQTVVALLPAFGVDVTPELAAGVTALASFIGAWATKRGRLPRG